MEGIEELAGNIELIGLQQPIRVRKAPAGESYIVVSGHRRREAILRILADRPDAFSEGIPCIIEQGESSEAMRELRLIYANASTRVMGSAEISRQAERVEELLYTLKEEGVEFPGRMRDHVAEACRVSKTKLARLHAIRNNLDPALLGFFDRGELNESAAYELSRLPAEIQETVGELMTTGKRTRMPVASVVEEVNKNLKEFQAKQPCRSHAGAPDCHWKTEKIVKSVFSPYEWQTCEPGRCCRDCYHGKDCSAACPECKDRRKLEKEVEKEKEAEREKDRQVRQDMRRKIYRKTAARLLPLIEAAGLADDDELPSPYTWGRGTKVSKVRAYAAGDFGDAYFNDDEGVTPSTASEVKSWAETLGCSADYLLGLSETPQPQPVSEADTAAKWRTGVPEAEGTYAVRSGAAAEEGPQWADYRFLNWSGEEWTSRNGAPVRDHVYRWLKLPEV